MLPKWYQFAIDELGTAEISGGQHNKRVVEYHQQTGLAATDDETSWCASFVAWSHKKAGIPYDRRNAASSRAWLSDPNFKRIKKPLIGATTVFPRGSNPKFGHIGFFAGWVKEGETFRLLSGNDSNRVKMSTRKVSDVLGFLWPKEIPQPISEQPLNTSTIVRVGTGLATVAAGSVANDITTAVQESSGEIQTAAEQAREHISWGTYIGIALGVIILLGALWIIYSRFKAKRDEKLITEGPDADQLEDVDPEGEGE